MAQDAERPPEAGWTVADRGGIEQPEDMVVAQDELRARAVLDERDLAADGEHCVAESIDLAVYAMMITHAGGEPFDAGALP